MSDTPLTDAKHVEVYSTPPYLPYTDMRKHAEQMERDRALLISHLEIAIRSLDTAWVDWEAETPLTDAALASVLYSGAEYNSAYKPLWENARRMEIKLDMLRATMESLIQAMKEAPE